MAQAFIASLAATLFAFGLFAGVFALLNALAYAYGQDSSAPTQTAVSTSASDKDSPKAYHYAGHRFEITWDAAGKRAVIRHPTQPEAAGYVLASQRASEVGTYTGQLAFGHLPEHNRHSRSHPTVRDAVNWVCDRLLERRTSHTDLNPDDRDASPKAIRDFVESLSPSSPSDRH